MYTLDARLQMNQSVATAAACRQEKRLSDVSAGVPKAPVIRELFVDALSDNPIGEY